MNLGDYPDTTGAVCGQFAGAYLGELGIPAQWRDVLARKDLLETALEGLLGGQPGNAVPVLAAAFSIPTGSSPVERSYWVVDGEFSRGRE